MLGPDQGYDGMYGQGPPSVHSSHGGRGYQPQGKLRALFPFFFFFFTRLIAFGRSTQSIDRR